MAAVPNLALYSLYGLTLQSDIPLHAPAGKGAPDLTITAGPPRPVPAQPAKGELLCQVQYGTGGAAHARTARGYTLRYFNTAEFEFNADLTRVTAHADPGAKANLIPEFLTASIPAFQLLLAGRMVLHASAVARNGKAFGILAQSGGGKSTVAATLCQHGFSPVTDDVLTLDWHGETPHVRPGPTELRLRPGSAALVGRPMAAVHRPTADARTAISFPATDSATQLQALITLAIDPTATTTTLTQLNSSESLAAILGHLRVAGWKDTDVLQRIFAEQVRLARQVPGYRLTMPRGEAGLAEAVRLITQLSAAPCKAAPRAPEP